MKSSQKQILNRIHNIIGEYIEGRYTFEQVAAYIKGAMNYHCREIEPWGGTPEHDAAIYEEDDSNE